MTDDKVSKKRGSEGEARLREANYIFMRCLFALIVSIIAVAVACYAWFSNNKWIQAGAGNIAVVGSPFELATAGVIGRFDIDDVANADENIVGSVTVGEQQYSLYDTASDMNIEWRLVPGSNLANQTGESLAPGSFGKLEFYVIPKRTDPLNLSFQFDMLLYENFVATQQKPTADRTFNELNAQGTRDELALTDITDDPDMELAKTLLTGHILFFEHCENGMYSGLIENGSFEREYPNPVIDEPILVTLYWVWPKYLDNLWTVSDSGYTELDTPICQPQSEDYQDLLRLVFDEPQQGYNRFLTGYTVGELAEFYNSFILTDSFEGATYSMINSLRSCYDRADHEIGAKVRYIVLSLTANETTA